MDEKRLSLAVFSQFRRVFACSDPLVNYFRGGSRLKNPGDLTDQQAVTLRKLKRKGGELWRAYTLKEGS